VFKDDSHNYTALWADSNRNSTSTQKIFSSDLNSAFNFTKSKYLDDSFYAGMAANYLPGGYVYKMEGSLAKVQSDLISLQQLGWIDHRTRALFFDFTLFNPNVNLFAFCSFVFEILPTGGIISTANVVTMNIWTGSREVVATGCMAAYLVVISVLMAKEIKSCLSMKKEYFKQFWIYIDWLLFAFSWTALPMYLYKMYAMHKILKNVAQNNISYINLSNLTSWNSILSMFLSFCTFLATIKLNRLLRFNKKLSYLTNTVKKCMTGLASFSICFLILWMAFTQLMYLIYNDKTLGYATFIKSMESNFLIILGKCNLAPIVQQNYTLGAIIFASFNILIVMIMTNVLVTIISDKFAESRKEAKKIKVVSLMEHLAKKLGRFVPKKKNTIQLTQNSVNYSQYLEFTDSFEVKSTYLFDKLKYNIENDLNATESIKDSIKKERALQSAIGSF